jgi:hypothetical protein
MDQTKFINTYIANLAEQTKAATLEIIMLKTQVAIANETIAELTAKLEAQDAAKTTSQEEADVLPLSDYK